MNPENTGRPTTPRRMYTATAKVPRLEPSSAAPRNTAKVCSVTGTGPRGMEIQAQTTVSPANRPTKAISFVFKSFIVAYTSSCPHYIPRFGPCQRPRAKVNRGFTTPPDVVQWRGEQDGRGKT